jgi:uridine monophosphate synthetase
MGEKSTLAVGFFDRLAARAAEVDSLLCVGLDPRGASVDEIRDECGRIIAATADAALAFKPNSAFFEAFGPEGMLALLDVIATVPDGIPVILDAKRGDIADTAQAYARAAFETLGAGAITINPYLGGDSLTPFIVKPENGVFVVCKTSNPGADEFQGLEVRGGKSGPLYAEVARRAQEWNRLGNVGLVVGASDPAAMAQVRALAPDMWFLVPGVGAQGGDLKAALAAGLRSDGLGLAINASRSIARASDPGAEAARLRDVIRQGQHKTTSRASQLPREATNYQLPHRLAAALLSSGCVKFGQFALKSGLQSPIYLDLRRLVSFPDVLRTVARAYAALLVNLEFDRLAGIPYAALPIATAIGLEMGRPVIYPRREAKDYGTRAVVEGEFQPGETAVVIDDLVTTGESKFESIEKLAAAGLTVRDIVVLIDREQGAAESLARAGYRLHTVATLSQLLGVWKSVGAVTEAQADEVRRFIRESRS